MIHATSLFYVKLYVILVKMYGKRIFSKLPHLSMISCSSKFNKFTLFKFDGVMFKQYFKFRKSNVYHSRSLFIMSKSWKDKTIIYLKKTRKTSIFYSSCFLTFGTD